MIQTLSQMKTNREQKNTVHKPRQTQRGSALIYILIAVALFAALGFALSRQTDTSEAGILSEERAELYATQITTYAAQARSAVDQMLFTGATLIEDSAPAPNRSIDFTDPSDGTFEDDPVIHKLFHPQGGGLILGTLAPEVINEVTSDPDPGWYIGRFNNVDWTDSTDDDVILTAYQITEQICGKLNEDIIGDSTIPTSTEALRNILIDDAFHGGTNVELTTGSGEICPDCENLGSLCIQEGGIYAFYTIVADQ